MGTLERIADSRLILLGVKPRERKIQGTLSFMLENPTTNIVVRDIHTIMIGNRHSPAFKRYGSVVNWISKLPGAELVPDFMLTELESEAVTNLSEAAAPSHVTETATLLTMARGLGLVAQKLILSEVKR